MSYFVFNHLYLIFICPHFSCEFNPILFLLFPSYTEWALAYRGPKDLENHQLFSGTNKEEDHPHFDQKGKPDHRHPSGKPDTVKSPETRSKPSDNEILPSTPSPRQKHGGRKASKNNADVLKVLLKSQRDDVADSEGVDKQKKTHYSKIVAEHQKIGNEFLLTASQVCEAMKATSPTSGKSKRLEKQRLTLTDPTYNVIDHVLQALEKPPTPIVIYSEYLHKDKMWNLSTRFDIFTEQKNKSKSKSLKYPWNERNVYDTQPLHCKYHFVRSRFCLS